MPPTPVIQQMRQQFPHVDLRLEHDKFTDYWNDKTGKDATKQDWVGTWRNWIRKAAERGPGVARRQQETDGLFSRAAQRLGATEPAFATDNPALGYADPGVKEIIG